MTKASLQNHRQHRFLEKHAQRIFLKKSLHKVFGSKIKFTVKNVIKKQNSIKTLR